MNINFNLLLNKKDEQKTTQYLVVLSATITLFTAGIYQGWAGPSLIKIFKEYPVPISQEEASYITIIGPVGHVIGGFLSAYLADFIGRKLTVLAIGVPQVLSFILIYFADYHKCLLYISRVLGGIGEGASLALIPCYISEIAEPSVRGLLGTFVNLLLLIGQLFINTVGSFLSIHTTALISLVFPLLFWLSFIHMPESPYYCLMQKNINGAIKSLQILRRKHDVSKEITQLISDVDRQMSENGTYKDLFTIKSNRRALILVSATRTFQVFTGSIAMMSYLQIMISEATDLSPIIGSTIMIIAGIFMIILSTFYIDKFGRKPTLIISSLCTAITLSLQAIFLTLRDYTSVNTTTISWLPILIMALNNLAYRGGLGVVTNIFISEIYSTSIKAKAMSLGSLNFAIAMIISTKMYQVTADYVDLSVPFYIFAFSTFLATLFFYFILPETKGKTLERIQQELKDAERYFKKKNKIDRNGDDNGGVVYEMQITRV